MLYPSDLVLPEVYVPRKSITVVPRLLTRKARASVVCHLQRKTVGVKASKKKKKGNRFSAALKSTFFLKIWFLVYLAKISVVCECGFC